MGLRPGKHEMSSSQIFDLVVVGTLLFCAWKGAARGLVSQAAWVIALILCFKFSDKLAPAIEPAIAVEQPLKKWVAMAIVYLGLCLASFVAASIVNSWLEKARLKDFDRHLGALLGLIKGVVICMTVMFFSLTLSESARAVVSQSRSGYAAAVMLYHLDPLIPLVPDGARDTINSVREAFNRGLIPGDQAESGNDGAGETDGGPESDDWSYGTKPVSESESGAGKSGFQWPDLLSSGGTSGAGAGSGKSGASEPTLEELLRSLPSSVREEVTSRAMDALRNSSAEQKKRLLEELRNSVPQSAGEILDDFVRSEPVQGGARGSSGLAGGSTGLSRSNTAILDQIAGIYGDRQSIISRTKQYLAGVPEQVQNRVLEDWHADVMLLQNDPDPGTNVNTRLDDRILRQLGRSGISLERLDRELRTRLSQSIR